MCITFGILLLILAGYFTVQQYSINLVSRPDRRILYQVLVPVFPTRWQHEKIKQSNVEQSCGKELNYLVLILSFRWQHVKGCKAIVAFEWTFPVRTTYFGPTRTELIRIASFGSGYIGYKIGKKHGGRIWKSCYCRVYSSIVRVQRWWQQWWRWSNFICCCTFT